MKHFTIFYLTSLLFLAAACSDEESDPFGGWESGIELSAESVTLSNDAPSQTVYVGEGQGGWYITAVTTDDNKTVLEQQEQEALRGGADFERAFDWLTVKVEGNAIGLTAAENAGWDRSFVIDLAAYGCVARITGGQLAHSDGTPLTATPQDVRLSFRGGSATVETGKANWWVASVLLGETPYEPYDGADKGIGERPKERTLDKTFGWLGVKAEGTQLVLSAEKNRLDQNQTFAITLTDGTQECTVTGQQYCIYNEPNENDAIRITPESVEFGPEGGEVTVSTNFPNWWFSGIKIDGELQDLGLALQKDKDLLTDSRIYKRTLDGWLTVEVVGPDGLRLTAAPNTTGRERTFEVGLSLYYVEGKLTGVQHAE